MVIFPLQDLLSLGSEARLNTPGASMGNWQWRFTSKQLENLHVTSADYLKDQLDLYGLVYGVRPSILSAN